MLRAGEHRRGYAPGVSTLRFRLVAGAAVLIASLVLALAAAETYARARGLDLRLARATAVSGTRTAASRFLPAPETWDLPYLPRVFRLDDQGLETAWGSCRFDHAGPTVLVFGDSTTRQASGGARARSAPPPDSSDVLAHARWEAERTWPTALRASLGPDTQLCVVAEDGYHPADYAELARHLLPLLKPERLLVLLCDNDLQDIAARQAVEQEGWMVVYELPPSRPVYPPLWQPQLYEASEAFRFVHLSLSQATGNRVEVPYETPRLPWAESLQELAGLAPTTLIYLPRLAEPGRPSAQERALLDSLGLEVKLVELSPPWDRWRREERDDVHLSDDGHAELARQLAASGLSAY